VLFSKILSLNIFDFHWPANFNKNIILKNLDSNAIISEVGFTEGLNLF